MTLASLHMHSGRGTGTLPACRTVGDWRGRGMAAEEQHVGSVADDIKCNTDVAGAGWLAGWLEQQRCYLTNKQLTQ